MGIRISSHHHPAHVKGKISKACHSREPLYIAHFVLRGFYVRYSEAELTFAGYDVDAGGLHYGVLIGYGW